MGRGEKHILLGPHSSYPGMCSINKTKNVGLAFNPQILCPNALVRGQVKLEDLKLSILTSQGCSQGEHWDLVYTWGTVRAGEKDERNRHHFSTGSPVLQVVTLRSHQPTGSQESPWTYGSWGQERVGTLQLSDPGWRWCWQSVLSVDCRQRAGLLTACCSTPGLNAVPHTDMYWVLSEQLKWETELKPNSWNLIFCLSLRQRSLTSLFPKSLNNFCGHYIEFPKFKSITWCYFYSFSSLVCPLLN